MVFVLERSETVIILVDPRFDADNAPEVEAKLKKIIEKSPKRVLFDFAKTEYVASAGMRVLLSIARSILQKGGKVVLSSLSPNVRKVFEIAGFTNIFPIFPTREEALLHLQES
jgi:anti-anti-sigma factor